MAETRIRTEQVTGVKRNDNGTVTTIGNLAIVTGWGVLEGNNTAQITEAVSFGVTFASAPVVVCQSEAGYTNTTAPTSIGDSASGVLGQLTVAGAHWHNITTTGFTVYLNHVSNNFNGGVFYRYSWIAIGELA